MCGFYVNAGSLNSASHVLPCFFFFFEFLFSLFSLHFKNFSTLISLLHSLSSLLNSSKFKVITAQMLQ